jgi:hypothetical protein
MMAPDRGRPRFTVNHMQTTAAERRRDVAKIVVLPSKNNALSIQTFIHILKAMERSKQIQVGLLAVLALLLIANLFGGGFKNWFGKSDSTSHSVASLATNRENSGNIPGTNVDDPSTTAPIDGPVTTIQYEEEKFEFGTVDEGQVVKHVFRFKNTGNEPLVISNAKGSCGCTVPTWPKEPVPPGGTGEIKVEFNTKGKPGRQSKRVTVTANTNPTETFIEVAGEVRGKDVPAAKGAGE